jgi:hypothetical protein
VHDTPRAPAPYLRSARGRLPTDHRRDAGPRSRFKIGCASSLSGTRSRSPSAKCSVLKLSLSDQLRSAYGGLPFRSPKPAICIIRLPILADDPVHFEILGHALPPWRKGHMGQQTPSCSASSTFPLRLNRLPNEGTAARPMTLTRTAPVLQALSKRRTRVRSAEDAARSHVIAANVRSEASIWLSIGKYDQDRSSVATAHAASFAQLRSTSSGRNM